MTVYLPFVGQSGVPSQVTTPVKVLRQHHALCRNIKELDHGLTRS